MTTTLSPAPDETVKAVTLDGIRDLPARPTPRETLSQSLAMAWRATKKMRRNPEQWFDVTLQPLLFTAMFAYIFGGAISGSVADYLPILIPGILAQTALTASMSTGVQLREDMDKGVFDRFKSLPIARIAPLVGPAIADLLRYGTAATLTIFTGWGCDIPQPRRRRRTRRAATGRRVWARARGIPLPDAGGCGRMDAQVERRRHRCSSGAATRSSRSGRPTGTGPARRSRSTTTTCSACSR